MQTLKIYILFSLILFLGFGCADLDDPVPINSIPTSTAIVDVASAEAALNGVYSSLQDADLAFDGWLALGQYFSDECDFSGTFPTRLDFGNLNVFPANGTMATVFSDLYIIINRANNVIALVPTVVDENFTDEDRNDIIAQASFLRAQSYLHLVTLWQDVPLILQPTTDVAGDILFVPTSSADVIFDQIEADFQFAESSLLTPVSTFRASQQTASAFLARVALERGDNAEALARASAIVDSVDLTTIPYMEDQIYSLNFTATDGNSIPFFYGPSGLNGRYSIHPSDNLLAAYEPGDLRRDLSVDILEEGTPLEEPFSIKYPSFEAGIAGSSTDPVLFIRHAEMALIAAEAAAQMGDFGTASGFINQVRNRAGLADITLDAGNFVDAILQERFVELAMEGVFRLVDLRRLGQAEAVLGPIGYDSCDDVWPLPQRDVDRNINLTQNDCCNC